MLDAAYRLVDGVHDLLEHELDARANGRRRSSRRRHVEGVEGGGRGKRGCRRVERELWLDPFSSAFPVNY